MNFFSLSGPRLFRITSLAVRKFAPRSIVVIRKFCSYNSSGSEVESDSEYISLEDPMEKMWKSSYFDLEVDEKPVREKNFYESMRIDAERVLEVLRKDGPGFDTKTALDDLDIRVSGLLVRNVFIGVLKNIDQSNKTRCAKLGFKFFVWSSQRESYEHTHDSYHLLMKIFAECEEFKAMTQLVDEMIAKGLPMTARTFNIIICTCKEAGLAKQVIERFITSKNFKYRAFKHSYNAILICLLVLHQYRLIEWVYEQMLSDGHLPDVLTYNVLLWAKYRLGKIDEFHRLIDEMGRSGFSPDLYTYNILLHVLGKGDKPIAAMNLLQHMREIGIEPTALHFTTLMDGLSRAGNLEACRFFFDEISKNGGPADVVCYTVMITSYVFAGKIELAREVFDEMIERGLAPNVYTYNSMIRGLCDIRRFDEARSMLVDMESKGCKPNFHVYSTLVYSLRCAGKFAEAEEIVSYMVEKGQYVHLIDNLKGNRRF